MCDVTLAAAWSGTHVMSRGVRGVRGAEGAWCAVVGAGAGAEAGGRAGRGARRWKGGGRGVRRRRHLHNRTLLPPTAAHYSRPHVRVTVTNSTTGSTHYLTNATITIHKTSDSTVRLDNKRASFTHYHAEAVNQTQTTLISEQKYIIDHASL
ncbi:hypothetical protein RR46_04105 [Papilio xuthus]|uniref:Uncharacterized protein n=1 Tax=Papilio xuthus TaxID=66420 RepID=A0A194QHW8_PAPXU|nr:hypothetical protein RR46_04105 [Papilio xuthus]